MKFAGMKSAGSLQALDTAYILVLSFLVPGDALEQNTFQLCECQGGIFIRLDTDEVLHGG